MDNATVIEFKKLRARLENTEIALLALWTLLEDNIPSEYQDDINRMLEQYYDANKMLGMPDYNGVFKISVE